jgi:hypothetical protein
MHFIVPDRDRLPAEAIDLAYLANQEESPFATRAEWQSDLLVVEREESESGTLTIPWLTDDGAPLALTTGTLIERAAPYLLTLELARGTINRLRTYAFVWPSLGLVVPEEWCQMLSKATQELGFAATNQIQPAFADQHAQRALEIALRAGASLCEAYGQQSSIARRNMTPRAPFLVGATLSRREPALAFGERLLAACNTVAVPFDWSEVESSEGESSWLLSDKQLAWCQAHELTICGGPLVRLDADAMPGWIGVAKDFELLLSRATRHIQAAVERYRGRVNLWNCGAGINTARGLALTDEQRLRLAVRAVETVRLSDPRTPVVLTIDQPWGESLRDQRRPAAGQEPVARSTLSPIHFADALLRGDLGLAGFGLRIDIGNSRDATLPRDVLEIGRQIDRWSVFNLPLLIELTLPATVGAMTEQMWINQVVPVFLGKPAVQAILWGQLFDGESRRFPNRGLFDGEGLPKPALGAFSGLQRFAR